MRLLPRPTSLAAAAETKEHQYAVRFTESLLARVPAPGDEDVQHAYPSALAAPATPPTRAGARPAARPGGPTPIVRGVRFDGNGSLPTLGIVADAPAGTTWVQFVVDSAGHVDAPSAVLPTDADAATVAVVQAVLARVRFSPARRDGVPTCELLRMPVNVGAR